jgi:hypothetical protein
MNQSRYVSRHFAQKALAGMGLIRLQEVLKRATGRWRTQLSPEFLRQRIRSKAATFKRIGLRLSGHVVEQGTGWYGLDPVLFYLGGATRIDTYDTSPWLNRDLFLGSVRSCLANLDDLRSWIDVDAEIVLERSESLRELLAKEESKPLFDLLRMVNTNYVCTRSMNRPELPEGGVDFFYTDSVLQRMELADLHALLTEVHRFLREGGTNYHVVDCKDFHAIANATIPECWYLTISDGLYNAMTSKYVNYQNRLRMPEFLRIFKEAGLQHIDILDHTITPENEAFCRTHAGEIGASEYYDISEVAVSRFEVIATK